MSKINLEAPFQSFRGKICKHSKIIFAQRGQTQYTSQICNPRTKAFSEAELARQNKFKTAITNLMRTYQPQFKDDDDGMTRKVGEECFAQFGDTYWWFYYFSRGVHTY